MTIIDNANKLLAWNVKYLRYDSGLVQEHIAECFADEFIVFANGRKYDANHQNYFEFLQKFKETIQSISYEIDEYIWQADSVVLPMRAKVVRINDQVDYFDAMLWLKFNTLGKVTYWHEVYTQNV